VLFKDLSSCGGDHPPHACVDDGVPVLRVSMVLYGDILLMWSSWSRASMPAGWWSRIFRIRRMTRWSSSF
jgi:hypothetical protein